LFKVSSITFLRPRGPVGGVARLSGTDHLQPDRVRADLEAAGYITRTRSGRRTRYTVNPDSLFRHPSQDGHRIGPFLALLATADENARTGSGKDLDP
jgi:hypothetical protein